MNESQLRARLSAGRKEPEPFIPPRIRIPREVSILAVDGALVHTGMVRMIFRPDSEAIHIPDHETITLGTREESFLGTWDLAAQLSQRLGEEYSWRGRHCDWVVIEAPSVGGGKRTESSLIAGLVTYLLMPASKIRTVSAQHASKILCGNAAHDKKEITEAVLRYIPGCTGQGWSQHQRDAAAIGITHIIDTYGAA